MDNIERLFNDIYWDVGEGGNTQYIKYAGTDLPIHADTARFQKFLIPLTTGPIRIEFFDGYGNPLIMQYPPGLTGLQILGALNTMLDKADDQGETVRDQLSGSDKYIFNGFRKHGDTYFPSFE